MERILIIGGNGCGKTTLAQKLARKLELPLIHLDILYWRDNWQNASKDEFDDLLLKELSKPKWILDGNINRTIPLRLKYCDTLIYMDFSRTICVYGAIKRVIKNYGKSRLDMGGYCPEKFDKDKIEFIKSIWKHDKENRKRFYDILNNESAVNKIVLKNRRQVNKFLQRL
ncbi:AAA family ATPase [Clostridium sp. 19966]|uniref:AAA family ATPase n=1 Tax=Clostridium sp. 19966 TaxID=2768166 RepID=UPI0028DF5BE5|nr:AAA family ATPase [Clostridium sp. 19966]MDT8718058.1 AAA family ATPase [Clostridium sp. 19966]